jgi:hypothetical protein
MSYEDRDERRRRVVDSYGRTGSAAQTARELDLPHGTVWRDLKAAGALEEDWDGSNPAGPDPVEVERKKAEETAKKREHVQAVKELAFRQFLEQLVEENVRPIPRPPARPTRTARGRGAHERHALLTLNDWHFEERVDAAGVLGLNSYDIPTACQRVYRVVNAALDWKRDLEAGGRFRVPKLTVALMGDLLTGTLHGLERHSGAPNIVRAALACGDLVALALADLATEFPEINVVGIAGNHGRLPDDRKTPTKDPTRSWDYLAYQVARRRLSETSGIRWDLPESYGVLFDMAGHLCYAAHGNFIPNQLGVIGYGVRRFGSTLAGNLSTVGKRLRYCFLGHWHSASSGEFAGLQTFICPSLIGTQEYGFLNGGNVNRPAQMLHVFDRDLGLVSQETLFGDGPGYDGTYEIDL